MWRHYWSSFLWIAAASFLFGSIVVDSIAIRVKVDAIRPKCFFEDTLQDTLIVISAKVPEHFNIELQITHGNTEVFRDSGKQLMKTAFTTTTSEQYAICLMNLSPDTPAAMVALQVRTGTEARDYSQIAKKEHLDPLVVKLRVVEDLLRYYHRKVMHMRGDRDGMSHLHTSTARRVVTFCLLSVGIMSIAMVCQVLYFRNFLKSKKII